MARIKTGQKRAGLTWQAFIQAQVKVGKALPIISNTLFNQFLFRDQQGMLRDYAHYLGYPDPRLTELGELTQYSSVKDRLQTGSLAIKHDYINWVKSRLLETAEADGLPVFLLEEADKVFDEVDFQELSRILGYPRFGSPQTDPFLLLAQLPLPLYITTGYNHVMQAALRRVGKRPRSQTCRWIPELRGEPSVFDEGYQPTVDEPLVYHLLGDDTNPAGLVLTQDNYMEFLVNVVQDMGCQTDLIPAGLRHPLTNSSIILLGYDMDSIEFRTLYWSLLHHRIRKQTSVSVLKLNPNDRKKEYKASYLRSCAFEVYWGDLAQFIQELNPSGEAP
ncbi:MAG: SIR2 family protein [Acidobacteriota bacterium]|nr:SIR2 family protein [Acidobacteriota bacterium]